MSKEIWKDIPGYEGYYQASSLGNIKSLKRLVKHRNSSILVNERLLKQKVNRRGYAQVGLYKLSKRKYYETHQLVVMAFLGHIPCGYKIVVDHKNHNETDNNLDNLQIITQRENLSKDKRGFTSKYTGVSWHKHSKKWRATIKINSKAKSLGYYNDEIQAHNAYQKKISQL